ncbi:multiheme c-type cytochrome [Alsobacter sp. KACC 23698]|uniref:Multiheme c-type cytochrome n=1 Tax=Alsobacter sp. KACC 23698 TaxID=3149229 RepID=A0AAU7JE50_9HYPH
MGPVNEGRPDRRPARPRPFAGLLGAVLASLAAFAILASFSAWTSAAPPSAASSSWAGVLTPDAPADHVGSQRCASCHEREAKAWAGSQHAAAMAPAEPATVKGDFSGARVENHGAHGRFYRDGDRFLVETEGQDGALASYEVRYTFGVDPLQQYLVEFSGGRLQALPWAWDARPRESGGQRWFHVYGHQPAPPGDPLHWTRALQTWNLMCGECHSTAFRKGYDPAKNAYKTTYSEISVGCEACHGAGAGHVAWAAGGATAPNPLKGFAATAARRPQPDWTPDPATGSPAHGAPRPAGDEVETCARCHSRRGLLSEDWRPGRPLEDTHMPVLLSEGLFEADGQMRDEVFNDHAFKQSLMYAKGVVCGDCHDPHSGALKAAGAAVCGQCHQPDRFADRAHTGHAPGPNAPDCVSCHMPAKTYMVVDRRHDHSFRTPRPDLSDRTGAPNACGACHADRSAQWAADSVKSWRGPTRKGLQTWGEPFALARRGDPGARDALIRLAGDPAVPAVARATAQDELGRFPSIAAQAAAQQGLADPAPLARIAAMRSLARGPADQLWRMLLPLAADPVLAVRVEAARLLAGVPPGSASPAEQAALEKAFAEFEASHRLNADRSEHRSALAAFLQQRGRAAEAERELLEGLTNDPSAAELAVNLSDLYRTSGREAQVEQTLRSALRASPDSAGVAHALGLSLVRQKRYPEALDMFARATALQPDDARFAYVHAVALTSVGRAQQGRELLAKALADHPWDVDLLSAVLADALRRGDRAAAAALAPRLAAMRPDDAEIARLAAALARPSGP